MIPVIQKRKIPFIFSAVLVGASVLALLVFGLKPGIDFTGGSLLEVSFEAERPSIVEVEESLAPMELGNMLVQPTSKQGYILKTRFISETEHQTILATLRASFEKEMEVIEVSPADVSDTGVLEINADGAQVVMGEIGDNVGGRVLEERIETIGPSISSQLKNRAIEAAIAVIIAIVLYVAYAFRKVSRPVKSWKYGITAIVALIHDVTITLGVFAVLGRYAGVELDIPIVVALLTILGYSVNDTIVVFDRVRENLINRGSEHFDETVNIGVNESFHRSINTSFTTLVVLFAVFLFGGASVHYFALALIIGIVFGTYSSLFLASPLLVVWEQWGREKE